MICDQCGTKMIYQMIGRGWDDEEILGHRCVECHHTEYTDGLPWWIETLRTPRLLNEYRYRYGYVSPNRYCSPISEFTAFYRGEEYHDEVALCEEVSVLPIDDLPLFKGVL